MKKDLFDLKNKTVLITGGAGFLASSSFAPILIEYGATVIMTDHHENKVIEVCKKLNDKYGKGKSIPHYMNVTDKSSIQMVVDQYDTIDVLINCACNNPKIEPDGSGLTNETKFETMDFDYWKNGLETMADGVFLITQIISNKMLKQGHGNIILIGSDLSIIAPDNRIYDNGNVKPIFYSVGKHAVIGFTKYLSVYFAKKNIRVNALCPSGIFNNHQKHFVDKLSNLIPMGRMCLKEELQTSILYLCSDNSSYTSGSIIIIDGGKTII